MSDLIPVALITPGAIQVANIEIQSLFYQFGTLMFEDMADVTGLYPALDLVPLFLLAGASVTAAPLAGEDGMYAYHILIPANSQASFYERLEDLFYEATVVQRRNSDPQHEAEPQQAPVKLRVLRGGKA
ncbi:hypothetical protein ACP26L_36100 (plasmid) [Paenibacillus sp. S-38]|uniref:hypothetical protein n=1 Tax=Paenibacillus sp. S-38 TaxID=3416710 RepID=UPI003CF3ABB9